MTIKIDDINKYLGAWAWIVPIVGCVYQCVRLWGFSGLYYFSWTQVISDSVVVMIFLLTFFLGGWISVQLWRFIDENHDYFLPVCFWSMVTILASVSIFLLILFLFGSNWFLLIPILIILVFVWLGFFYKEILGLLFLFCIFIFLISSTTVFQIFFYFSGEEFYLMCSILVLGIIFGIPVFRLNDAQKISFILIFSLIFSLVPVFLNSSYKEEVLIVDGRDIDDSYTYDIVYQNDRHIFGSPGEGMKMVIFPAGQDTYRIIHTDTDGSPRTVWNRIENTPLLSDVRIRIMNVLHRLTHPGAH